MLKENINAIPCAIQDGAALSHASCGYLPPLFEAIDRGEAGICRPLVQHGADVDQRVSWSQATTGNVV